MKYSCLILALMVIVSGAVYLRLSCEDGIHSKCMNETEFNQTIHPIHQTSPIMQAIEDFLSLWELG